MEERKGLVGKLEQVGSQLRAELVETKERLKEAQKELEAMRAKKKETEEAVAGAEAKAGGAEAEIIRLTKRERQLVLQVC